MCKETGFIWKDIYIWSENNQVKQVETIEQALELGKAGYQIISYLYLGDYFLAIGVGNTVVEVLKDALDFGLLKNIDEYDKTKFINNSLSLPEYLGDDLCLFPASNELISLLEGERLYQLYKGEYTTLLDCNSSIFCNFKGKIAQPYWH